MAIQRFYTTGITYKIPVITRDAAGGEIATLGDAIDLLGRVRPMSGAEVLAAQKRNVISTHVLYCDPETNLTVKCKVFFAGVEYDVKYIKDPMTYGRYWIVDLELIR